MLVESAAWLWTLAEAGLLREGQAAVLGGEHLALADSLRIAEAANKPTLETSPRLRRLGVLLSAVAEALGDGSDAVSRSPAASIREATGSPANRAVLRAMPEHSDARG